MNHYCHSINSEIEKRTVRHRASASPEAIDGVTHGSSTDESWSLVLWLGHCSHRHSGYRLGCVRCLSSAHPSSGQESSWSTPAGLHRGRLAGRRGSGNFVAAQPKDWRRGIRHRLLDFCNTLATSVQRRNSCVWLANRRL